MFPQRQFVGAAVLVAMALATGGCVLDQHSEFRGHVTWGGPASTAMATNPVPVQEIGESFQTLDPEYTNALTGYGWTDGKLVIIHDRQNRDQTPGVYHLYGTFAIERWKSDLDFRIRLKMQSTGTNPVVIDGIVTDYESVQFNPLRWIGLCLGAMGIAGE